LQQKKRRPQKKIGKGEKKAAEGEKEEERGVLRSLLADDVMAATRKVQDLRPAHKRVNNPLHSLIAGACAGAINKTSTAPFERVKILCQTGVSPSPFSALRHVLQGAGAHFFFFQFSLPDVKC
jgi:hypothetical protein